MTEDQRCQMLSDYLHGMKQAELAAKYQCSPSYPTKLALRMGYPLRRSKTARRRMAKGQRQSWRQRRIDQFTGAQHV
jgi:uncharacterized protein YjcR